MKKKFPHIFLLICLSLLSFLVGTYFTSPTEALVSDAQDYTQLATQLASSSHLLKDIVHPAQPLFIDSGYAIFLSLFIRIFGFNLIILQLVNYLLWGISAILLYLGLKQITTSKKAKTASILTVLSPVFMTFSAKLYSEPLAAFAISLIIFSLITLRFNKFSFSLFFGGLILLATKSIFLPLILLLLLFLIINKKWLPLISLSLSLILIAPLFASSVSGGRSRYTLAVQTAKLEMDYSENLACIPYNLSFPLGELVLPSYRNTCIIFQSDPNLPRYQKNPVRIANQKYFSPDSFTYFDAFQAVLSQPFKYLIVIFVDLFNLIFIEGFYANVLLDLPLLLKLPLFLYGKLLSLWLWYRLFKLISQNWPKNKTTSLLFLSPLIYFVLVVSHFHIEPRYFYPFLPWLYLASSLTPNNLGKLASKVIKS